MALTTITRTVDGTDLDFYEVANGGAGAVEGILIAAISQIDIDNLNEVDSEGTGADLKTKMDGYKLSNGRDALVQYANSIVNVDDYADARMKAVYGKNPGRFLSEQKATLDDHEARITTLEP